MEQEFIDIQDMQKMSGWMLYERRVRDEIDRSIKELQLIEIEGRNQFDIAADLIRLREKINGLSRALEIPEEIKERAGRE